MEEAVSDPSTQPATTSEKRRYILVSPWPVMAGTGVNNAILGIRDAASQFYDPVIINTGWATPPPGQIWARLETPTLPVRNAVAFGIHFLPNLFKLRRLTRNAVAVNLHFAGLQYLPFACLRILRLSPPLIVSVHGADVEEALQSSALHRLLYRWLFMSTDLTVACSAALAEKVKALSPRARTTAIWNGVANPPAATGNRPINTRYVISVAAFVRKKAHDVLLRAFRRVADVHPDLQLVLLAGHGPEHESVLDLIQTLKLEDRIRIHVDVPHDQIWTWLSHAECFVLASRDEPFGIAVLEAAMARAPVVATRVGGVPEFLHDGVHGLLSEPDQPEELATAILRTLEDPAAARARADAFYLHARHFTWNAAFEKYRAAARLPR
jgi:glycosyltransferase involved in cell wall biosynthesis